jgi:RNA polymerase sigma-70 factor (ECF subfamily)
MTKRDLSGSGDGSGFSAVYRQHLPAVSRYLCRRLGDDVGEDAAADVFTRALASSKRSDIDAEAMLPWLYGIAANVIAERRRAERRRMKALQRAAAHAPRSSAGPEGVRGLSPALMGRLRELPDVDREALLLMAWGGLSYDQIAVATAVPIGTVRSRISRARGRLRTTPEGAPTASPSTALDPHA